MRNPLQIQVHVARQAWNTTGMYQCMQRHIAYANRLTRPEGEVGMLGFLFMCCDGGWGGRRGIKDREEVVIYDILIL